MQPPTKYITPPTGQLSPNPNEILELGNERWLAPEGRIITEELGNPVDVTPQTLEFWQAAAAKAGYALQDLLA